MINTALRNVLWLAALVALSGCMSQARQAAVTAAVSDPTRLEAARERDATRKPEEVLMFSGIGPGDRVVEIAPAGGYYTGLLSRVVGDEGHVYAVDPERIFAFFPRGREGFPKYIQEDPRTNVTYSSQNLDAIDVPSGLDQVWMVLYYHDTLWTGEDRAAMNKRFFDALKPGGVYLVVDHSAVSGAPESVGQSLHRMDPAIALTEIMAAGFRFDSESDVLRNPEDPLDDSVFGAERRGKTDRFIYRFRKP